MKRLLFVLLLFSCFGTDVSAQYYTSQNKVWVFGSGAGLDFNSGSPVAISTSINTFEGCASVSDSMGDLLFYTDGKNVYNKLGAIMASGGNIVPFITNSTEQAALIVPVIGNPNQFYLFSLESLGTTSGNCNLAYSVVDMALDGGLGDVIGSSFGIHFADSLDENMIAITGNNIDIWLITHRRDTNVFLAYNISSLGINTIPVMSSTGNFNGWECYGASMLKSSPNRQKIAQAVYQVNQGYGAELYDFDPNTGIVSNGISLDTFKDHYGVEFSPDNTKLYFSVSDTGRIIQYDISLPSIAAIIGSATEVVSTSAAYGKDFKLGPDGKIYFAGVVGGDHTQMDCISAPNLSGTACNYIPNAVTLVSGTEAFEGLPNLFVTTDTMNRVGVNELKRDADQISIYPNPATTQLTIQSTAQPITQISITNLLGQTVYSWQSAVCSLPAGQAGLQASVDVSAFPAGMYFVKVNDSPSASSGQAVVRKFLKE